MKMDRQVGLAAIDVEKFSKIGTNELKQGRITPAIDAFEYAYRKSKFLNDPPTERSCAFNLGAAYIAGSEFHDGLEILKYAEPPDDKKDTRSNGDLYFNFGLGLEGLKVYGEAINYYKLAKEEYNQERDNTEMEADAIEKMAKLYNLLGKKDKALASYKELCGMYELMGKTEKQAATLFEQANHCLLLHNSDQAEELADECLRLMGNCDKNQKIGNMYNDTGLLYTQLQKYEKAVTCFEEALPIIRSNNDDKKREAVILQNLGAIYNFLGDYQRSIAFHEEAASKYAALQNRKSQGQCFANLAFAFSQLQDTEGAGEAFLHALQAASDTEDKRTMWQVLEGLGAVAFNRNDVEKCIKYLKRALGIIATDGSDVQSQERIVGKLTFALQKKIAKYSEPSATSQYNDSSRQLEGNHRATTPASNRRSNRDRMKTPPANRESEQGGRNASRQSDRQLSETKPAVKKLAELPTGEEIVEVEGRLRMEKEEEEEIEKNCSPINNTFAHNPLYTHCSTFNASNPNPFSLLNNAQRQDQFSCNSDETNILNERLDKRFDISKLQPPVTSEPHIHIEYHQHHYHQGLQKIVNIIGAKHVHIGDGHHFNTSNDAECINDLEEMTVDSEDACMDSDRLRMEKEEEEEIEKNCSPINNTFAHNPLYTHCSTFNASNPNPFSLLNNAQRQDQFSCNSDETNILNERLDKRFDISKLQPPVTSEPHIHIEYHQHHYHQGLQKIVNIIGAKHVHIGDGHHFNTSNDAECINDLEEMTVDSEDACMDSDRLLKIRRTGSERQFTKICRGLAIGDTPREIPEVSSGTETETESETETETETEISESEESRDSETERKRPVEKRKEDSSGYETPIPQQELLKQREDKLVTKAEVHRESAKRREDPAKNGRPMTSKGQGVRINNAPSLLHTEDEKDRQKMQEHYLKFLEKNDDSPVRKPADAQQVTTEESETESGSTYDSSETETSEEETEEGEEQPRNNSQNALKPTSGMNYANLTYEEPVQQRGRNAEQSEKDRLSRTDPTYATIDFERTDKLNLKSRGNDGYEEVVVNDETTTPQKRRQKFNYIFSSEEESEGKATTNENRKHSHGGGEAAAAAERHNNDEKENTYETIENINREEHPILSILPRAEQERLMFKEHQKIQEEQKNKVEQEELKRKQAGDSKTCVVM